MTNFRFSRGTLKNELPVNIKNDIQSRLTKISTCQTIQIWIVINKCIIFKLQNGLTTFDFL